ncbi:Krueppel-like protein 1 [Frankliniella fusca]|uniref:Krueppel-like protein 1 n=2 Tax=Frankliniella fusca TaxID=407009 RepID=A0AAE1HRL1_9NEOP|nr:Krueppel-like protein 1 [Frankliniella fusca]
MQVCSRHFKSTDYFPTNGPNLKPKLKKNAVPSENLPVRSHDKINPSPIKRKNQARSDRAAKRSICFPIMETDVQLQCRICKKEFTFPSNLTRHMNECHNDGGKENSLECNLCNVSFSRKDNLMRHMRLNHEDESVKDANEDNRIFKCPICNNVYQHRRTLRRHVKDIHAGTGNWETASQVTCNLCDESFIKRAALLQHCAEVHQGDINNKEQGSNPGNKSLSEDKTKNFSSKCDTCNLNFSSTESFAKHYLECGLLSVKNKKISSNPKDCSKCNTSHKSGKEFSSCKPELQNKKLKKGVCVYEGCSEIFFHRTKMIEHLEKEHFVQVESEVFDFNSFDEFVKWKTQTENDTYTSFTAPCGKSEGDKVIHRYYTCQLEASDNTHRKTGQAYRTTSRKWKERGSIPKGHYCPARMLVAENIETGHVNVNFIETHNHQINYENYKYRKVPKATQNFILALLSSNMAPRAIKHLLQGEAGDLDKRNGEVRPIKEHFIDEKYIKRLKYKLKSESRFHSNDATSADVLVKYLMTKGTFKVDESEDEFSPVTVYKPQGNKTVYGDESIDLLPNSKDLFLFGFQTREQLKMLQQGAKTVVCLDFTYKITQYDFYLFNVLVPDEFGKGYPVAHFITNRQDILTATAALNSIKERCPDLNINFLMTDDDQSEWQAMEAVFGEGIRRGICKYHLFRTWQRKLNSRDDGINDINLRREVYHALTVLCHEKEMSTFKKILEAFKVKYRALCPTFVKYFEKEYSMRPHLWALCYRNFPHGHTDTNMYCESFHNKIKTFYLERKQNRRVDDLINLLQEAERDRYLEHLEMVLENRLKAEVPISHKRRHVRGIAISDDDISCPESTQDECRFWIMKSQSSAPESEEYFITRYSMKCELDHCYERCPESECLQLCSHLYTCTCADASALCKHIHKVHSLAVRLREFKVEETISSNEESRFYNPEPVFINEENNSLNNEETSVNQDEKIRANCMSIIQDLQSKLSTTSNTTMLQFFQKQLKILQGHSNAFSQSIHSHELEKLEPTLSVSGPQKVVPYKDLSKFYRTTKKFEPSTENKLTKPTYEERTERKRSLLSLSDREDVKRAKNEGPSSIPCSGEVIVVKPNEKSTHHQSNQQSTSSQKKTNSKTDSRSFTPKLGYTSNIHEPVLFFDGQDSHTSSVTFRALKSLDPFVTSEECKSLNVTGSSNFKKGWIFDEIINAYFDSLCKRRPDTHYFCTLFSDSVNSGGSLVKGAFQFHQQEVNIILIPLHHIALPNISCFIKN